MGVNYPEIRKFSGLYLQQNSFDVPDGALEICSNVEIQSDAVLSKTKGWYNYYEAAPDDLIRTLVTYQDRLMAFSNEVSYFDIFDELSPDPIYSSQLNAVALTGDTFLPANPPRTAEQNDNLYFTTLYGAYKLEAYNSKVRKAGVPPGLDLKATAGTGVTGPLPADSQTSYRIVFGRRDTNGNLLLGAPSDIATVGLDPDATGVAYTSSGAGPYIITVTTLVPHGLRVGDQIIVTNATDADANGTETVTAVPSPLTFRYSVGANPLSGTLDYTFTRTSTLEFSVPSEIDDITDDWFYQVYRTISSAEVDVSPTPDFGLIAEVNLTSVDISVGFIFFTDTVDPILIGAQLYTNPNSREGELQANARPPMAQDIQLYKEYMLYANCQTKQRMFLTLVNPSGITASTQVIFSYNLTLEVYFAVQVGVANQTVNATAVAGVGTITITYPLHGASNGWTVQIEQVTGTLPLGDYVISGVTANTFNVTSLGNTATAVAFSFLNDGLLPIFFSDITSSSLAVQITNTAYSLVKAINRNSALMYANYVSGFDDNPGQIRIELKQFDQLGANLSVRLNFNNPQPFLPPLPTSFGSGVQVYAINDVLPDAIYISKLGEPDAVPVLDFLRAGAKNQAIKRIFTLRDSVIILKEDGIYKLTGDTKSQFSITIIDGTVLINSAKGADKINNTVIAASNQGIVSISESSVQIVSRRIDDIIQPIVGGEFAITNINDTIDDFVAFGYETGRTWYFCQKREISGIPAVTLMYNVLNQSWTSTDVLFECMGLGPDGTIYISTGQEDSIVYRQRKSFTVIDYSNEFAVGTAIATGLNTVYAEMVSGNIFTPIAGDVVLYNNLINRITDATVNGIGYDLTFVTDTTIPVTPAADVTFYQGYDSDLKFSPFHAGQVGREKQFSQFQLHLRQNSITDLVLNFANETVVGSGNLQWQAQNITQGSASSAIDGWGDGPWGLFEWGSIASSGSIQIQTGTAPALIIRTYVPILASRTTFIQAIMSHRQALEPLLIQSLSYVARGYGERVSR